MIQVASCSDVYLKGASPLLCAIAASHGPLGEKSRECFEICQTLLENNVDCSFVLDSGEDALLLAVRTKTSSRKSKLKFFNNQIEFFFSTGPEVCNWSGSDAEKTSLCNTSVDF